MFVDEPLQEEPIRVYLRLRPINKFEQSRRSTNCIASCESRVRVSRDQQASSYAAAVKSGDGAESSLHNTEDVITIESPVEGEFNFVFDKVFNQTQTVDSNSNQSQGEVYQHVGAPLASHALEGFNCALIAYGQTGSGKSHTMMGGGGGTNNYNDTTTSSGMIHRTIQHVFQLMKESPPTIEFIVRCSYVEIYLEKVLDLLNPTNRSVKIASGGQDGYGSTASGMDGVANANTSNGHEQQQQSNTNEGGITTLHGASEACCFNESDVMSLLVRGNASRTVSSTKMNTDSSRSHAIFVMKIEQKDGVTGISKASQLVLIDMAGSELGSGGGGNTDEIVSGTKGAAIHQEARMVNQSLTLLNSVVKTIVKNQTTCMEEGVEGTYDDVLYRQSKLTHLLQDAFGGNCRTSLIVTASPASYNISESLRTMKFGAFARGVTNSIKPSVEMSPLDYRKLLNDSQKKQGDLTSLVNELSAECFQLKQDAKKQRFVESHYDGPLWKTIETILVNGATPEVLKSSSGQRSKGDGGSGAASSEEVSRLRMELENSRRSRENVESLLAERQSEVAVLRTQIDNCASERKRVSQELVTTKNEIRVLTQRKQEVEHNLRTSQFREYEATVFLRQFRRFYRRLLRNKAHQGTGRTSEVIERVPGVPDLNDLIDVDSLLLEAGLIEESELHDDTATGAYRPSAQALARSTDATNKAWQEAARHGKVDALESFDRSSLGGVSTSGSNHGEAITSRQQFLGTPAGRLTTMREKELERDLLRATERCIELQVSLNEEKANVDILSNRSGNLNKKKFAQESIQLKQQLDKKTHDLQAIIWKMNELHLINKTYNEKMSNREQHVTYLEENLVELQSSNRNMILERQKSEHGLRDELDNLKVLVDAMTVPLWQFGECGFKGRTLASRIRLPVCSGVIDDDEGSESVEVESLESLEGSVASGEDDEHDDESEHEEVESSARDIPVQRSVPTIDAATQTTPPVGIEQSLAVPPAVSRQPLVVSAKNEEVLQQSIGEEKVTKMPIAVTLADRATTDQSEITSAVQSLSLNGHVLSEEYLFSGGKPAGSQPCRFTPKFGLMIRPGVLKESKAKPERASRPVKV